MPARRLEDDFLAISAYDVAGQDSLHDTEFVTHVGLSAEDRSDICRGTPLFMVHMIPPLQVGGCGFPIQMTGSVPLTVDQQRKIGVFIDERRSELLGQRELPKSWQQYTIIPHFRAPDENFSFPRFSCAGFVIEAYQYAQIDLVKRAPGDLPLVQLDTLIKAYPDHARHLQSPAIRSGYGLENDREWPAILAGYVINSLARESDEIVAGPYRPLAGDEYFPPRRRIQKASSHEDQPANGS